MLVCRSRFSATSASALLRSRCAAAVAPAAAAHQCANFSAQVDAVQQVTSVEISKQQADDIRARFSALPLEQALQLPLQWRESVLQDGSILYRHPTQEQVMSVKLARLVVMRAVQKRKREQAKLDEEARLGSNRFIPRKTLKQQQADEARIADEVHKELSALKVLVLSPEQIAEVRKLRLTDPLTYSTSNLAKLFHVRPEHIAMVSREPEEKVKQDLRELKERNQNRPKHASKQHLNR